MSSQVEPHGAPSLRVRRGSKALISAGRRVLLVRECHADGTSFWTLPGGGVEREESMVAALERELVEELHCRVSVERPVASFWYAHSDPGRAVSLYTVFECGLATPTLPNGEEGVLECQWVRAAELPPETVLGVRTLLEQVVAPG